MTVLTAVMSLMSDILDGCDALVIMSSIALMTSMYLMPRGPNSRDFRSFRNGFRDNDTRGVHEGLHDYNVYDCLEDCYVHDGFDGDVRGVYNGLTLMIGLSMIMTVICVMSMIALSSMRAWKYVI
jgi:hypothetical protein